MRIDGSLFFGAAAHVREYLRDRLPGQKGLTRIFRECANLSGAKT